MTLPWARRTEFGWRLSVRVQPSAGNTVVAGTVGGEIKIRVAAPADRGKANAELCRFLAGQLGVHRSAVSVVQGERNRSKIVEVIGDAEPAHLVNLTAEPSC